eukprot:TRINITY_DN742_c7_g2_i1.p2 TRINITY_DN742_c7_g2~~TRINITY_DN742_c7_g2_i1.p2  ORF type:complete len:172 (+),score=30.25 TRINITY_DN742_c7_g2_i1:123-638(+)
MRGAVLLLVAATGAALCQAAACGGACQSDSECPQGCPCWGYVCDRCHGQRCNVTHQCPDGCGCSYTYCSRPAPSPAPAPEAGSFNLKLFDWDTGDCSGAANCGYSGKTGVRCLNDDRCFPVEGTCRGGVLNLTAFYSTPGCGAVWRTETVAADGGCHEMKSIGYRAVATCA